ncbi:MAG: Beta-propeller repeat protein [Candidatus Methanohalarchaeum thermophilum]|uniref:Beta-propeller repeat protein n=1 Tax=Methanohalarchaeum thermophilum TaxID=1903181 RepID=A0A1Q6DX95_METT1|nr:MAG: Beta-propeller repeat protein [Candidatus Methanohalarchaeum thermophilum]
MTKKILALTVISAFVISIISVGMAPITTATNGSYTKTLTADGDELGEVRVTDDGYNMSIEFTVTDSDWCFTETMISIESYYNENVIHSPCKDTYTYVVNIDDQGIPRGETVEITAEATIKDKITKETLYLTDSGLETGDGLDAKLFEVEVNETENKAYLTHLKDLAGFDQVDALACSADGKQIYAIEKFTEHLGVYNVTDGSFTDLGEISGLPEDQVVLAAFSPNNDLLYVAGDNTDQLYTIDVTQQTLTADSIGEVEKSTGGNLDIQGADLVFAADGTLYIWVNPSTLYKVEDVTDPSAKAVNMGSPSQDYYFTGLAILEAGTGDLVASVHSDGDHSPIYVLDPTTANVGNAYNTYLGTDEYQVGYGDMTVGELTDVREASTEIMYDVPGETFDCEIYAGAGQNDITKATHVGNITVDVMSQEITITLFEGFGLKEAHLYVGEEALPMRENPGKGRGDSYTVAPGQFPYKAENLDGAMTYTFQNVTELDEDAHFILHVELTNGETGFAHCDDPTTFTDASEGDIQRWGWTNLVSDNINLGND